MRYKLISSDWSFYVMCVDWRCTAPLGDNLIYCRNIGHPELRCCCPSLKWEVPVTKSSVGDIFRPFLKGLKISKLQTSGRRLGPPEKVLHVFSSGLLPMTSNFWLVFKLKGGRVREFSRDDRHTSHISVGGKQVLLLHETGLRGPYVMIGEPQSHPKGRWIV